MKRGDLSLFVFGILVLVATLSFVVAISYDVAPSTAEAGDTVSLLKFNITSTTGVSGWNLTTITLILTGNASIGNLTSLNVSDGTSDYSNGSITGTTITIDASNANASAIGSGNLTINATLNSSATYGVAFGVNVSSIGLQDTSNVTIDITTNSSTVLVTETTNPTASASCSPSVVETGASFPCTCSGTDSGATASGVSTSSGSSTSPDGTSTPVNTGSFTYTCTVTDNAGNSASSTATYTVSQSPASPVGVGSQTSEWTTHSITQGVFQQGYTRGLEANNRIKFQFGGEDHFVGVLSISGSQATIEISSDPVQVTLGAGEDAKVDLDDDGFYDVFVLLNGVMGNEADVTIQEINEAVPEGGTGVETGGTQVGEEEPVSEGGGISVWVWILIIIIILALWWGMKKKK